MVMAYERNRNNTGVDITTSVLQIGMVPTPNVACGLLRVPRIQESHFSGEGSASNAETALQTGRPKKKGSQGLCCDDKRFIQIVIVAY